MSKIQLLDKTRKINKLLHNNSSSKVVFNDICNVLKDVLTSNVLVISRKGKVLGCGYSKKVEKIETLIGCEVGGFIDKMLNERLVDVLCTKESVNLEMFGFTSEEARNHEAIVTPIYIAGERLGTLLVYKMNEPYSIDDIILCEYGATVVGLEMMRSVTEESEEENRRTSGVKAALNTLSSTEKDAVVSIFEELSGLEGVLVASRVADRVGITRSVIVNALRKLESAGIIVSKSSGMKGTYIKVTNEMIFDELEKLKK